MSPLTWGRGLKLTLFRCNDLSFVSPLTWGRGLKLQRQAHQPAGPVSPLTWGRGLKHPQTGKRNELLLVAPHVGAWIETADRRARTGKDRSPLSWGRGLKRQCLSHQPHRGVSPLTWGRGLKLCIPLSREDVIRVAPHVGAWIETAYSCQAPLHRFVTPHVGAWIETLIVFDSLSAVGSPLTWGRGLKH